MTGNVIFLGISALTRDWGEVTRHMAPIIAFLLGVVAARLLSALPIPHSAALTLGLESLALFGVGLLPASLPQFAFTSTVAFVSAFQVTTFRRVGRFTYNSTFVTGNLRDVAEGWFDAFFNHDPAKRHLARAKSAQARPHLRQFPAGRVSRSFRRRPLPRACAVVPPSPCCSPRLPWSW